MQILFVGEKPVQSAPTLTWAKALKRIGVSYKFIDFSIVSTPEWITEIKSSDAVVYQGYGLVDDYVLRQLSIATVMLCPVIRKWSGSDVYYALCNERIAASILKLDKIISLNLTSEHEGLVSELDSIGIKARLTEQVLGENIIFNSGCEKKSSVLVYLPDSKYEFYGKEYIEKAIEENKWCEFVVIGDSKHSLEKYNNVISLGWLSNMEEVWDRIGCLIRITTHDGFPRTIVEALARGKYVIHNRHYPGCWYAQTHNEITFALNKFNEQSFINMQGIQFYKALIDQQAEKKLLNCIVEAKINYKKYLFSTFNIFKYFL